MKSPRRPRLVIERLEDRLTPSWGTPWPSPETLTISFAPDGTNISGVPSDLSALLGPNTQAWETTILKAYQTWAIESNINLGLVPDGGEPFGTPGLMEGDPRFGDIRIGAIPLSSTSSGTDLADTVGFDPSVGTWSGDFLLNSNYQFNNGGTSGAYDLYSVALHEAGHSFGFADNPTDPNSVEYPGYQIWTGLAPEDISAIQSLYGGTRTGDAFQGTTGNGSLSTAFNLSADGNLTSISAGLSQIGQAEYFQFTTPGTSTGVAGLNINLQAAGISLLTSQLTVLDSNGNVVASTVTTDPTNNNLSISLPNYSPSTTYYVEVAGAQNNVFAVGSYNLQLNYTDASGNSITYGNSFGLGSPYVNTDSGGNSTLQTAQTLGSTNGSQSTSFSVVGTLASSTETDWYQITPVSQNSFNGTLTVGVIPQTQGGTGVDAQVAVYDSSGNLLPSMVVNNQDGGFTVQLANQSPGTTYYISVSANPISASETGGYVLSASLSPGAITTFDSMQSTTLNASTPTVYSELSLNGGRVVQFSLSASTVSGAPVEATGLTVLDSNGNTVLTLAVEAGSPPATETAWLGAGNYFVVLTGATQDGSALQNLTVYLSAEEVSDPMDPNYLDPIMGPPSSPPTTPTTTPPATLPTTGTTGTTTTTTSPPPTTAPTTGTTTTTTSPPTTTAPTTGTTTTTTSPPTTTTPTTGTTTPTTGTTPTTTPTTGTTTTSSPTTSTEPNWFTISTVSTLPILILDPIGNPFLELE